MDEQKVWLVEVGEYEQSYVALAFTTKERAEEYAAANDGRVFAIEVWDRLPNKVPYWHFGANVFPDGSVERWDVEHESDEPGMEPVDKADRLHDEPWDGHTQGHCGFHVSVFGSDRELTEATREEWVTHYLPMCDGRCRGCGRTENYIRGFGDEENVEVVLVGGPKDGELSSYAKLKSSGDESWDSSVLVCLHMEWKDGQAVDHPQHSYGPVKRDGDRWVRHYIEPRT